MTDQKLLVDRILAGDQKAFKILVQQYQRLVTHFVFRMIPVGPEREDICQDVFVKVYQHLNRFRFESSLSTWIGRITYNTCLNYLDKKKLPLYDDMGDEDKSFEPVDDEKARPDFNYADKEISTILKGEIEKLPPIYRTIVTLFHLDEMSYAEIADIMKMPEGTIKSYLFRARKQLKEKLSVKYRREDL
jgi:RNA polymerase sigma-70 factor (ECF subfamily)